MEKKLVHVIRKNDAKNECFLIVVKGWIIGNGMAVHQDPAMPSQWNVVDIGSGATVVTADSFHDAMAKYYRIEGKCKEARKHPLYHDVLTIRRSITKVVKIT